MLMSANAQYTKIASGIWEGTASYYHDMFNGRLTSNGEIFSNEKLTAASNFLALGCYVRVTNLNNGKSVVVKINDRMHEKNKRLIDLSRKSAQELDFINEGLAHVRVEVIVGNVEEVPRSQNATVVVLENPEEIKKTEINLEHESTVAPKKKLKSTLAKHATQVGTSFVVNEKDINHNRPSKARKRTKPKTDREQNTHVISTTAALPKLVKNPYQKIRKEEKDNFWEEKKIYNENNLPDDWIETVSQYEMQFKEEPEYLYGPYSAYLDSSEHFSIKLAGLPTDSNYRFILLSRAQNELDSLSIAPYKNSKLVPSDTATVLRKLKFYPDARSFIYFFEYKVPSSTTYIDFQWSGINYPNASFEDYWLFVFKK